MRNHYIEDTSFVPLENAGGNTGAQASSSANGAAKTRSRPNAEYVLYSNGEPVAMSADGDTSYFGTDILGSVRSVTDKYGAVKAQYEYDAFGSPYLSNLENDVGFGYCGKVYDSDTGLYDYGFRDYSPNSARFTTVDPVRDGANWFSYCMNDAVNYVDLFGLETNGLIDSVKSWIEDNFTSEVINDTDYYLYVRTENDKNSDIQESLDNFVTTNAKSTLTESLGGVKIPTDGIVFPDGSVYKGWSGSKVTVTEKNGNIEVKQSVGTAIANGIANLGKAIQNIFLPADQKKEYYGYYTKEEVAKMEGKQDSIAGWKKQIEDPKSGNPDYFNQKSNTETKATQGCTK